MADEGTPCPFGLSSSVCSPEPQDHRPHRSNASTRAGRNRSRRSGNPRKESVPADKKDDNSLCLVRKAMSSTDLIEKPSSKVQVSETPIPPKVERKPVNCNLDHFLDSTCPSVRAHHLPKSCQRENCRKRQKPGTVDSLPYFILGDLWDFLDEWSAYGAGVPITLKGHTTVVQYYVPYLSALQIYTRSTKRQNTECREIDLAVPDCIHCKCWESDQVGGMTSGACCQCNNFEQISKLDLSHNIDDEHCRSSESSNISWTKDWHQHLRFEYFESSPPFSRVPISEKISELAAGFPELKTLRSVDLLPASWMSIAWYPIYRIPTGPTLKELEACFLTFHNLSTSLLDGELSGIVKPSSRPMACANSSSTEVQHEYPTIHLEAFGLAHYKLRGSIWTSVGNLERKHAASLYRCAEAWLQKLKVGHPDFDFFTSHNPAPAAS
ncbi:hypothetical protein KP509_01G128500 [Ceratopteris richardii]|uniref:Uncharacterized protein n=1 Tax=Ceratopteris richardii TaxID=49495 RepID=A0A8T2VHD6_CERRI|nr:hypothetical protein KP509_01G128500 [Ceratopteris richardii]